MFVDQLRNKIEGLVPGSPAKNLLKVVLGDIQTRASRPPFADVTEQECHVMVKKMIKANDDNIDILKNLSNPSPTDPRIKKFQTENVLLNSLLPRYWSEQDIRNWIKDEGIDVKAFPNEGAVMGQCMSMLKGEAVEGNMVKKIIREMRDDG